MNGCKFATKNTEINKIKNIRTNELKKILIWVVLLILVFSIACNTEKAKFLRRSAVVFKHPNGVMIEKEWIETYNYKPSNWDKDKIK